MNKYVTWEKEDLVKKIYELENQLSDLLEKEDDKFFVEFPWAGNLGQWYWYTKDNKVVFNDKKVITLGYNPEHVGQVGFEFFTSKLHPDDYERVMDNMRSHLSGKSDVYEVEYRIQHKDGHYLWFYDRGTITKRDSSGNVLLVQGIVFDVTESKLIEEQLRFLSERDALTSVFNRRTMYKKLGELIQIFNDSKETFSMIMFDIDHFKNINDTYGHLVGDDVLRKLAEIIIEDKRSEDIVCRYGGEEFFLLLPDTKQDGAVKVAKRLRKIIKKMDIPQVGHITVSMGVTTYQENDSIDEIIKKADDLMYEAKEDGRDNIKY
ncbi:sensor domain-containing diguanylate cyclase [Mycoplasmatota bacterium]|nr:sensor domain-containing diguanylate cyclase [Mycoplasmatota bacterium]